MDAAEFADDDDGVGVRVGFVQREEFRETGSGDRVAAHADQGRNAEPALDDFGGDFVGQGAAAGHDPDVALLVYAVNPVGDGAEHGFAHGDDARGVAAHDHRAAGKRGKRRVGARRRQRGLSLDLGLEDRLTSKVGLLSGGQRQRVAIARALINDPAIIMADEPTGNLDTKSSYEIMDIFKKKNDNGKTVVMVTHEPDIAEQTKRILTMRDGKLVSDEWRADHV